MINKMFPFNSQLIKSIFVKLINIIDLFVIKMCGW